MSERNGMEKTTAGTAALAICESLLISLNDLKIIDDKQTRRLLDDAAATHRHAISVSPNPDEHRDIATLIDKMMAAGSWVRKD